MPRLRLRGKGKNRIRVFLLLISLVVATYHYFFRPSYLPGPEDTRCRGTEGCFTGIVTRVVDGDTLDVNGERIRLVLVDAPERDTREGPASTEYLRQLCPVGSTALVDQDDLQRTDAYGRTLAVVWCGDRRVNEELIRTGRARLYGRFCRESEFGAEPWALELGCR